MDFNDYRNPVEYDRKNPGPWREAEAEAMRRFKTDVLEQSMEQFKADVLEQTGWSRHRKADAIFEYAWREGHAGGYGEVAMILFELAEVFK